MDPYKKIFKIKKVDDIFSLLEDDMATLSSQKTSPFYGAFKRKQKNGRKFFKQFKNVQKWFFKYKENGFIQNKYLLISRIIQINN